MKVTNDHYGHRPSVSWHRDAAELYITDDTGAIWAFRSDDKGLSVRSLGNDAGDDSIRVRPVCDNNIHLRATRVED